jgi:ABC-type antimicrobial peptide transport system permease subunit
MTFEDMDFEDDFADDEDALIALEEEGDNRTFLIIAGILGGIALLVVICIVLWVAVLLPMQQRSVEQQAAVARQNTEVALMVERTSTADAQTAIARAWTSTPTNTLPPSPTPQATLTYTAVPTTAVVIVETTQTLSEESLNATSTALQATANYNADVLQVTLTARASLTAQSPPSQMPATGFADDVGLPVLIGVAVLLIVVIFLARRLRTAGK